jgi:hypothetical protein
LVDFVIRTPFRVPLRLGAFSSGVSDFAAGGNAGQPFGAGVRLKTLASVSLAACLAAPAARAADGEEPLRVEFVDQAGCADRDTFMTAVRVRSARIREAAPGETARALRVVVVADADGSYRGQLTVIDDDSEGAWGRSRSIEGKACEEVVDALALFAVLAIDPTALTAEAPEVRTPVPLTPPPPVQAPKPPDARAPWKAPRRSAQRDDAVARARATFGLSGGMFAAGAATPLAGGIFSEIGYQDSGKIGIRFGPSVRLSLTLTTLARVRATGGSAGLRWTRFGLDACPVVLRLTRVVSLRPCVGFSAGLLDASGKIAEPESVQVPFRTVGALARGEWGVGRWLIELSGGVERPLRRDRFYFEPSTPVYESPPVLGVLMIGGGYRFL